MKFSSSLHCKNHVHYANIPVLKGMRVKSKSKGSLRFVVESLWELRVVGETHEKTKNCASSIIAILCGKKQLPKAE